MLVPTDRVGARGMAGFRSTGSLATTRSSFSAAWLDIGRVLVAGGSDNAGADLLATEAFDPTTETWSAAGSLHGTHVLPPLVSTPTGAVLVGRDPAAADALLETWNGHTGVWSSEIMPPYLTAADGARFSTDRVEVLCGARAPLDPLGTGRFVAVTLADGTVHPLRTPAYDRSNPYSCVLTDGRLLVVSGIGTAIGASITPVEYLTRTAEVYDPAAGTWTPTGRLAASHLSLDRANQCLVALPDGGALIVAGSDQVDTYTDIVERWSPSTNRWTRTAPLPDKRDGHTDHAAGHRHRAGRRRRERQRCPRRHLHLRPRLRLMEPRRHDDQTAHRARRSTDPRRAPARDRRRLRRQLRKLRLAAGHPELELDHLDDRPATGHAAPPAPGAHRAAHHPSERIELNQRRDTTMTTSARTRREGRAASTTQATTAGIVRHGRSREGDEWSAAGAESSSLLTDRGSVDTTTSAADPPGTARLITARTVGASDNATTRHTTTTRTTLTTARDNRGQADYTQGTRLRLWTATQHVDNRCRSTKLWSRTHAGRSNPSENRTRRPRTPTADRNLPHLAAGDDPTTGRRHAAPRLSAPSGRPATNRHYR